MNLGCYCHVKKVPGQEPYHATRVLDRKCFELGGIKMLYSSSFVSEQELDRIYNGDATERSSRNTIQTACSRRSTRSVSSGPARTADIFHSRLTKLCCADSSFDADRPTPARTNGRYGLGTVARVIWRGFV